MSSLYKALERARNGGAALSGRPSAPHGAESRPAPAGETRRFGREMQALAGRLQPLFDERPSVSLLITACGRGEGATTLTGEFAAHLADEGRRILHCGSHGGSVPADDEPAHPSGEPIVEVAPNRFHLDITSSYRDSGNVMEKNALRGRLDQLRPLFDIVLIDSPPVLLNASWASVMRGVDGVILVVEAEKTRTAALRSSIRVIQEGGGHIIGIVFNKRRQYIPRFLYRFL